MRSVQVTIKDIARELGISPSTVSRALKDHPDISIETKKAVTELAEKLNYTPNSIALSLRQQKTNTIGVIIPEIIHFFFSTVISGIEDIAYDAGYSVIVSQSNESYDREVMDSKALFNNRVDGMLISLSRETTQFDHLKSLFDRGVPMVFFDRVTDAINCSKVVVDDFGGSFEATEHLINQGYKRIAHLSGPKSLTISEVRLEGYKAALAKHNIPYDEKLVMRDKASEDEQSAKKLTEQLLSGPNPPDSLFAINDIAALGAMMAAKEKGLKIPKDFGIVGFSNWRFTSLTEPPMTTVNQPGFEMGQEAARLLIKQIEAKNDEVIEPETVELKTNLVIRGSSVPK
ncbi:LacI family DNA-binding transcriptional regulator [Fulvivirga lutea]|uniref:LacI family DNA-binding transcriptional regulator n=1 Tax=Fulvivirga lutea TaxID=2810512 RepID=A0A974ZZX5_9BACT|nr:LacI family DNA-binding transcriptional regulator [Fulvivirga lutea]QSE96236.1 LacI family DNA-binding transcriptional regulator [Fulvivirga lutea]